LLEKSYSNSVTLVSSKIQSYNSLVTSLSEIASGSAPATIKPSDIADAINKYLLSIDEVYRDQFAMYDAVFKEYNSQCPTSVSINIQQQVGPDPDRSFALSHRYNDMYNDSLTFGVDANGFISNGAPSSTPQGTAILSAIASDVGEAVAPGHGALNLPEAKKVADNIVKGGPNNGNPPNGIVAPSCITDTTSTHGQYLVDDLKLCPNPSKAQNIAAALLIEFHAPQDRFGTANRYWPGTLPTLPSDLLPFTFYAPLAAFDSEGNPDPNAKGNINLTALAKTLIGTLKTSFGITLTLNCGDPSGIEASKVAEQTEPSRVSRRLLLVRRRSHHEQDDKQVFT